MEAIEEFDTTVTLCFTPPSIGKRPHQGMLGIDPVVALDPCLQFGAPVEPDEGGERAPFVAVYGHSFSVSFGRDVRRWASSRGLRLVSVGYRNEWADEQLLDAGPDDFARLLARAEAVATNFFHGCVFALRNATPFACELSPYRSAKIRDLLTMLGGARHVVSEHGSTAVEDGLGAPVEPDVLRRIAGYRRSADAYLDAALA